MNYDDDPALFPEKLSDEVAYQLIPFFYHLAAVFESQYLSQALRYEKTLGKKVVPPNKPWENN